MFVKEGPYWCRDWIICEQPQFEPGDPPPQGYMEWDEWARVQIKAGLRQTQCPRCSLWLFPQERKRHAILEHRVYNEGTMGD